MTILAILALSTLLQFCAALVAWRIALTARRRLGWGLIVAALAIMAVHSAVLLYGEALDYGEMGAEGQPARSRYMELVSLAIAAMMLGGVVLIGRLVRESRQTEAALRDSEAIYRGILDNSIDTFYRTDAEGRVVMASRSVMPLLGYTSEEVIGQKLSDYYADADGRDDFLRALQENGGRLAGYETILRHKDGHTVPVATSAGFLHDSEGNVIGVEGTARDITDQKVTEALNTRLGRIIEDSRNEVFAFDSQTLRFLMVNRGARENLGLSMDELRAMTPVDIKPEFNIEDFEALVAPLRDGTKSMVELSTVHKRADGTTYEIEAHLQLARTEDPPVFFAIIQDVTERRRTEDALRQAQKMEAVGQLTGGIAHDFNNLLAVIVGSLDLAQEMIHGDANLAVQIERALGAAVRGANLTARLLAFSRRQSLMPQVVNLGSITAGMSEFVHRTLDETIIVTFSSDDDLWNCEVDRGQLENGLLNLVINARDAMPNGGRLSISTANVVLDDREAEKADIAPGSYVRLRVSDSGTGMSQETIAHAFEPFFTTKGVNKGTGLGLSMLHGFVKQSGGHVDIHSRQGHGTTVDILLPRTLRQVGVQETSSSVTRTDGAGQSILVVEDDADLRGLIAAMLQNLGYRTTEASSGPEAIAALESDASIRVMISDVVLPGELSGFDIAAHCKKHNPTLKVIFMSGYAHDKIKLQGQQQQDHDILLKPFNRSALAERLSKLEVSGTLTPAKVA